MICTEYYARLSTARIPEVTAAARCARAMLILDDLRVVGVLLGPEIVDRHECQVVLTIARRRGVEVEPRDVESLLAVLARQLGFRELTDPPLKLSPA